MVTLYWAIEYIKVFFSYMFLMFIWPSVVFRGYLKGKSKTFYFGFCVTMQPVLVNTVVICLGLIHLLNAFMVGTLFYGTFLFFVMKKILIDEGAIKTMGCLLNGTYGLKLFVSDSFSRLGNGIKACFRKFYHIVKGHIWEYGLLTIAVVYGMIYFSYGAFQDYSYGFGDMYPHNAWIYGLIQGQIFSAGVYPEGMHCFLYAIHILFGVKVYSALLFTAGIHIMTFLLSAYVLLKEIFHWRYTPMLALTMFLTLEQLCVDEIFSMSRLQWTLPQEFGLYTLFLCAAFLVKYLREANRIPPNKPRARFYWNENLIVFALTLAASLAIHFYATIMAFFLCVAFVPVSLRKIFHKRRFVPLVAAVAGGFVIAVLPMAGALASGIPFQGSIGWAMNVINGTAAESGGNAIIEESREEAPSEGTPQEGTGTSGVPAGSPQEGGQVGSVSPGQGGTPTGVSSVQSVQPSQPKPSFAERIRGLAGKVTGLMARKAQILYKASYVTLYRDTSARVIVGFTILAVLIWLVCRVAAGLLKLILRKRKKIATDGFDHYLSLTLSSLVYMCMYCASSLGLPMLIAESRLCSIAQLLIVSVMVIPVDLLFTLIGLVMFKWVMKAAAALGMAGIYLGTMVTGTFHGYLYFELTRHNVAVMTTYSIMESLPEGNFTIVSPVDELYQVIQYGYHEEAVTFINQSLEEDYTLPTEYVFLFIEKKPLQYGQSHFFTGPRWLAWEKYPAYYSSYVSQCPDITVSEISRELAEENMVPLPNSSKVYSNLRTRTVVESRLYEWCRKFEEMYPNELNVYYEDDDFICFYFKQNIMRLYQLAIYQ
ncbi:MAG: hypothetical protein NC121_05845 [Blautia sp.]|nr:hypothetical protein [Blautia sp.]